MAAGAAIVFCVAGMGEGWVAHEDDLIGTWTKVPGEECASIYPPRIELRPHGAYLAPEGPQLGSVWHGGGWRLEGGKLVVEAANDAELRYELVAEADSITLTDARGCRVGYRRG